ncbi:MAG TPA: hypothetical protein IAA71_09135 [Candidatus Pullichristensenella stercoripullorum]|nr:hypothetical protein [Candidatus Pullichristensenella stercoripullorum]
MIRFRAGDTNVRVHALALLMLALSFALGARVELAAMLTALFAHEGAHLLAARLLRVRVEALDLMPFGGALTLENPYRLGRWQLFGVSLAGPLANLLGLVATAALAWWAVLPPLFALELMRFHLMLAAFNLLPALPLDGGRALFALARTSRGRARMLAALTGCGYALAAALALVALLGWAHTGTMNLAILLPAVFLAASGSREKRSAALGTAEALAERLRLERGAPERPRRMRVLAVDEEADALEALRALSPREEALFAVYRGGTLVRLVDSRALERALLRDDALQPLKVRAVALPEASDRGAGA